MVKLTQTSTTKSLPSGTIHKMGLILNELAIGGEDMP
jgi:hypothetical protein